MALDHATSALSRQGGRLDELRGRASNVLGAAAIAAAFLGGQALDEGRDFAGWTYVAMGCLTVALASALVVLWPHKGWRFTVNAQRFLADYAEDGKSAPLSELQRDLALNLHSEYEANDERLRWLYRATMVATVAVFLEVLCWLLAIEGAS